MVLAVIQWPASNPQGNLTRAFHRAILTLSTRSWPDMSETVLLHGSPMRSKYMEFGDKERKKRIKDQKGDSDGGGAE